MKQKLEPKRSLDETNTTDPMPRGTTGQRAMQHPQPTKNSPKMRLLTPLISTLVGAQFALLGPLNAQQEANRRLFAVPASEEVVINGKLDDWDLSGDIFIPLNDAVADRYNAQLALMYDAEAIYIGAIVRDDTPMNNLHSPEANVRFAWNADAMQFRMFFEREVGPTVFRDDERDDWPVAHMLLWYYTPEQRPCLSIDYGMHFGEREGAIGGVIPNTEYEAAYQRLEDGTGYSFEYRIPWKVFGAENPPIAGDVVSGSLQFMFDDGSGLSNPRRFAVTDLVTTYATNPWRQIESWGRIIFSEEGNLPANFSHLPEAPASDTPLSITYELPEDAQVSINIFDASGAPVRRLLAQASRQGGTVLEQWDGRDDSGALLPAGTYTFQGIRYDPISTRYLVGVNNAGNPTWQTTDGKGSWGGDHGLPAAACLTSHGMALAWTEQESAPGIILVDDTGQKQWGAHFSAATHMTTDGARLFFGGTRRARTIAILDAQTGRRLAFQNGEVTVEPLDAADGSPPELTGLAYRNGTLYASYGPLNLVVLYDADTGKIETEYDVPDPAWLAPREDGSTLVISNDQVLVLNTAGELSPFVRDGAIEQPRGISIGPDGQVFVASGGASQNVAVFSADGVYQRSLGKEGGRPLVGRHDPSGMLEPWALAHDNQGHLWVIEHVDAPKRISVWETETGKNKAEYFGVARFANYAEFDPAAPDEVVSADSTLWQVDLETGEKSFHSTLWRQTDEKMPKGFKNVRVVRADNGNQYFHAYRGPSALYRRDGDLAKPFLEFMGDGRVWQDSNNDQNYRDDEFTKPAVRCRQIEYFGRDLSLWVSGAVFRPIEIDENGTPRYDFTKPEKTALNVGGPMPRLMRDPHDDAFYVVNPGMHKSGQLQQGNITKMTADGDILWEYPGVIAWRDAFTLGPPANGDIYGPWGLPSMRGDFFAVSTFRGSSHVLTRDGLYVAEILPDIRYLEFGPGTIKSEIYGGTLAKLEDGRYVISTGDNDARLLEVIGLDTVTPFAGEFEITGDDTKQAEAAFERHLAEQAQAMPLFIARGERSLTDVPKRGEPQAQKVTRSLDAEHTVDLRAAWDDENLYLRYDYVGPEAFVTEHGTVDLAEAGNIVELRLATDKERLQRLLVGRGADGQAKALLHVGEAATATDVSEAVTILDSQYNEKDGRGQIKVGIPLELLDWRPVPGSTVRLDLGYRFGADNGRRSTAQAYWFSRDSEDTTNPAAWGKAVLE